MGLLAAQFVLLGYQVRAPQAGGVRLVRLWTIEALLPFERVAGGMAGTTGSWWRNYIAVRAASQRNAALQQEVARLQLQNQQLRDAAREVPRLDALLGFQHAYGLATQAAEVISSGASADAQALYLDRGANAGLRRNQAVVTPDGAIGKLSLVLPSTAQVLLLTDPDSGAGALVGAQGIHAILRGLGAGRAELHNVLKDEPVAVGDAIVTSGEDQVFPKGIPLGTVTAIHPSTDGIFKSADVRLAADFGRLEQVLVVTAALPPAIEPQDQGLTAADVRQQRLPSLDKPAAGVVAWPGTLPAPPPPPVPGDGPAPGAGGIVPKLPAAGAPAAAPSADGATAKPLAPGASTGHPAAGGPVVKQPLAIKGVPGASAPGAGGRGH